MTEERKHAILFAATILAARKLSDIGNTPSANECAIKDAIEKAARIPAPYAYLTRGVR